MAPHLTIYQLRNNVLRSRPIPSPYAEPATLVTAIEATGFILNNVQGLAVTSAEEPGVPQPNLLGRNTRRRTFTITIRFSDGLAGRHPLIPHNSVSITLSNRELGHEEETARVLALFTPYTTDVTYVLQIMVLENLGSMEKLDALFALSPGSNTTSAGHRARTCLHDLQTRIAAALGRPAPVCQPRQPPIPVAHLWLQFVSSQRRPVYASLEAAVLPTTIALGLLAHLLVERGVPAHVSRPLFTDLHLGLFFVSFACQAYVRCAWE